MNDEVELYTDDGELYREISAEDALEEFEYTWGPQFSDDLSEEELVKISGMLEKLTPYPWELIIEHCDCGGDYPCGHPPYPYELLGNKADVEQWNGKMRQQEVANFVNADDATEEDARFIQISPVLVGKLIAALRSARREVLRLKDELVSTNAALEVAKTAHANAQATIESLQDDLDELIEGTCTCPCIDCIEGNHCGGYYVHTNEDREDEVIGECHKALTPAAMHEMGLSVYGCDCHQCRPELYQEDCDE